MSKLNKTFLQGNLVDDPELKSTTNGTPVCNFRIAVNTGFGEREDTLFMSCEAFGKIAEVIAKNFVKGKEIIVEGVLKEEKWEDKEGQKRSRMRLTLDTFNGFHFTSGGKGSKVESEEAVPSDSPF